MLPSAAFVQQRHARVTSFIDASTAVIDAVRKVAALPASISASKDTPTSDEHNDDHSDEHNDDHSDEHNDKQSNQQSDDNRGDYDENNNHNNIDDNSDVNSDVDDDLDGDVDGDVASGKTSTPDHNLPQPDDTSDINHDNSARYIVGIGASAGGLEALSELINHLPDRLENTALIIAQHLSPTYKSMLVELLSRETQHPVLEVKDHQEVRAGHIYVTPPDNNITLHGDSFVLSKPSDSWGPKPSVNHFFESLASEKGGYAAGIILSGTGSDGARGVRAIYDAGGTTLVQLPQTAKYDGMPQAAIATGAVSATLRPHEMGRQLLLLLQQPSTLPQERNSFDQLLSLLAEKTGTDFTHYKVSTIFRRLEKRLSALEMNDVDSYLAYIDDHPEELDALFSTVLIGVTSFYRDPKAFEMLEGYLRELVERKKSGDTLRIWVAGCASGEEAYTIAMIVYDLLGERAENLDMQVFATDIDKRALNQARRGIYSIEQLHSLPEKYFERFFTEVPQGYEVSSTIRAKVLFSKHDVASNPPFLRVDLISCRNLLIYFDSHLQKHVIPVFHYSLNPNGYLFLGRSETIGVFSDLFSTADSKYKIFRRRSANSLHAIKFSAFKSQRSPRPMPRPREEKSISELVQATLFQTFEHPYVVINDNLDVLEIRGEITPYLSLREGTVNVNVVKLAQEDVRIELRALISKALKSHQTENRLVRYGKDDAMNVNIVAKPLVTDENHDSLMMIIFEKRELSEQAPLTASERADEGSPNYVELEQELAATKEHLQTFIEELETSNEELQSLNEELQSSNEELQTANEELETSNEELQSSNEELQMAYDELRSVNAALEEKEAALLESEANVRALLGNTLQAFVLIDRNYHVLAFNEEMRAWMARFETAQTPNQNSNQNSERKRHLLEGDTIFDFLPDAYVKTFHQKFKQALNNQELAGEMTLTTAAGQERTYRYCYTPVEDEESNVVLSVSLALLDVTTEKQALLELEDSERFISTIFSVTDVGFCLTDSDGNFAKVNEGYCRLYGYQEDELLGQHFTMMLPPETRAAAERLHTDFLAGKAEEMPGEWVVQHRDGTPFHILVTASRMERYGQWYKVTAVTDLTPHREVEEALRRERNLLSAIMQTSVAAITVFDAQGEVTFVNEYAQDLFQLPQNAMLHRRFDAEEWNVTSLEGDAIASHEMPFARVLELKAPVNDMQLVVNLPDGNSKILAVNGAPVLDGDGNISHAVFMMNEITERKRTERKLQELNETLEQRVRQRTTELEHLNNQLKAEVLEGQAKERALARSERRHRLLAANIPNSDLYLFDRDLRILLADGTATKQIGLDVRNLEGQAILEAFADTLAGALEPLCRQALAGQEASSELRYPVLSSHTTNHTTNPSDGANDDVRYFSLRAVPIFGSGNAQVEAGMVLLQDITERKLIEQQIAASLSEKEVLLQEVHHRVKNNMQIISSLLSLQSKRITDDNVLSALQDSQERVQAMALVHERLYQSDDLGYIDFAGYLTELANSARAIYEASDINLEFNTDPVYLTIEQAIPCGLISNELLSNAFKYAFKGRDAGKLWIDLKQDFDSDDERVILSVRDNGVGFPAGFTPEGSESLGYRIVSLLSRQLEAELTVGNTEKPAGAMTTLSFNVNKISG
jgi:two-component system CheB/CheR fusion protein